MANLTEIFQQVLPLNPGSAEILASIVLFIVTAVIGWSIYFVFNRYFSKWAEKTETTLDDDIIGAVKSFIVIIVAIIGIEYALAPLSFLQTYMELYLNKLFLAVEILLVAFAITRISNIVLDWYGERRSEPGKNNHHMVFIFKKIIQIVVFIGAFFAIIFMTTTITSDNISSLALSAGAGGIALAFALQSTLTDFFSAFSIYFDRPFEIGDNITVGTYSGTVKSIGIKSTRLKLHSGEELVLSNKELTTASVQNFRKLERRRVTFNLGVTYDTSSEKLKKIPKIIIDIITGVKGATPQFVNFTEFGDFSLKFFVSYFVNSSDYGMYLEIQQEINYAIKEAFEREGIEMAFPTNVTYLKK
jgi:small-conductance mechanosensitive channel